MKVLINTSKTDEELLEIFKVVVSSAESKGVKFLSKKTFDAFCKAIYGKSFGSVLRTRFAEPKGSGNGFGVLKKRFGLRLLTPFSRQELIDHLFNLYQTLGRQPRYDEVGKSGISNHVFENHFGKLSLAIKAMYAEKGIAQEVVIPPNVKPKRRDKIGEDISAMNYGLCTTPVNEMGVVCLFSKIHSLLGFPKIINIQQDFPDCVAECTREGKPFRAKIEFKFFSSHCYKNKVRHGVKGSALYMLKEVDYLICWEKDSTRLEKETPVQIICLKEELKKLEALNNESATLSITLG